MAAREHQQPPSFEPVIPSNRDVICGRGKACFDFVGNRRFREIIAKSANQYRDAENRRARGMVVRDVFQEILDQGSRFLKKDTTNGLWYEAGLKIGKTKVSHALRDAATPQKVKYVSPETEHAWEKRKVENEDQLSHSDGSNVEEMVYAKHKANISNNNFSTPTTSAMTTQTGASGMYDSEDEQAAHAEESRVSRKRIADNEAITDENPSSLKRSRVMSMTPSFLPPPAAALRPRRMPEPSSACPLSVARGGNNPLMTVPVDKRKKKQLRKVDPPSFAALALLSLARKESAKHGSHHQCDHDLVIKNDSCNLFDQCDLALLQTTGKERRWKMSGSLWIRLRQNKK